MGYPMGPEAEEIHSPMAFSLHRRSCPIAGEGYNHVPDGREVRGRGDISQPEEAEHVLPPLFLFTQGRIGWGGRRH